MIDLDIYFKTHNISKLRNNTLLEKNEEFVVSRGIKQMPSSFRFLDYLLVETFLEGLAYGVGWGEYVGSYGTYCPSPNSSGLLNNLDSKLYQNMQNPFNDKTLKDHLKWGYRFFVYNKAILMLRFSFQRPGLGNVETIGRVNQTRYTNTIDTANRTVSYGSNYGVISKYLEVPGKHFTSGNLSLLEDSTIINLIGLSGNSTGSEIVYINGKQMEHIIYKSLRQFIVRVTGRAIG